MHEIDFSPPPKPKNEAKLRDDSSKKILSINNSFLNSILSSKIVWGGLILSIAAFLYGSNYIENKYDTSHYERVYSDIEFLDNSSLSQTYELSFESDTAQSIYTIEYQNFALENLKKILSLYENDIHTIQNVLPMEIENVKMSLFKRGKENTLLISTNKQSSIKKFPIIVNYALHFEGDKVKEIQSFMYTNDDFIIQDKLGVSKFANWRKKNVIIWNKKITIFEANLQEPVIEKVTPLIIEDNEIEFANPPVAMEKIVNVADGEETEESDENLTVKDLEKEETNIEDNEIVDTTPVNKTMKEPKEVFLH